MTNIATVYEKHQAEAIKSYLLKNDPLLKLAISKDFFHQWLITFDDQGAHGYLHGSILRAIADAFNAGYIYSSKKEQNHD